MATRSLIAVELPTGEVRANYCHWDGYPEYMGRVLVEGFTTADVVDTLIQYDMSSIDHATFEPEYLPGTSDDPTHTTFQSVEDFFTTGWHHYGTEFHYLFRTDGTWWVADRKGPINRVTDLIETFDNPDYETWSAGMTVANNS